MIRSILAKTLRPSASLRWTSEGCFNANGKPNGDEWERMTNDLWPLAVILPLAVGLIFFGGNGIPPSFSDRLKAGLQNPKRGLKPERRTKNQQRAEVPALPSDL